jgi:3-methyladenine DNA glycosylase AlkD
LRFICEGDKLLAIKVPDLRKLVKKYYKELSLVEVEEFLESEYNEIRFFGQQVIFEKYKKAKTLDEKIEQFNFISKHISSINHWNLVDTIAGLFADYAIEMGQLETLVKYSLNESVWVRRIGIVSCIWLLKRKNPIYISKTLEILDNNLNHEHEYIHKAVGWVLREVGKADEKILIGYLHEHWSELRSVTKSYATEKLRLTRDIKNLFGGK